VRWSRVGTASPSKDGMDDEEAQALRAEGFDPDDPAVVAAIDLVRWELSLVLESPHCGRPGEDAEVDT
jgi:hypothetical protein